MSKMLLLLESGLFPDAATVSAAARTLEDEYTPVAASLEGVAPEEIEEWDRLLSLILQADKVLIL